MRICLLGSNFRQKEFCSLITNRQILILKSRKLKLGGSLEKVDAKVYLHYLDIANTHMQPGTFGERDHVLVARMTRRVPE
jgi:hypothetical protein